VDLVQILLDKGLVSVNESNAEYRRALQAASYDGHQKVVQTLLDTDADFNTQGRHFGYPL
jgi:ankyrin repeat protein